MKLVFYLKTEKKIKTNPLITAHYHAQSTSCHGHFRSPGPETRDPAPSPHVPPGLPADPNHPFHPITRLFIDSPNPLIPCSAAAPLSHRDPRSQVLAAIPELSPPRISPAISVSDLFMTYTSPPRAPGSLLLPLFGCHFQRICSAQWPLGLDRSRSLLLLPLRVLFGLIVMVYIYQWRAWVTECLGFRVELVARLIRSS